jgi:shikimate kinase
MGSGKSTLGRALARHLGCAYADNDATIEALAGRSTVELSGTGGGVLHEWESRYTRHVSGLAAPVVAGIPASAADRPGDLATLRAAGVLIYLRCDLDTLVGRIEADPPRPWIGRGTRELLTGMLTTREPVFTAAADLVLDGTAAPEASIAQIVRRLGTAAPGGEQFERAEPLSDV